MGAVYSVQKYEGTTQDGSSEQSEDGSSEQSDNMTTPHQVVFSMMFKHAAGCMDAHLSDLSKTNDTKPVAVEHSTTNETPEGIRKGA